MGDNKILILIYTPTNINKCCFFYFRHQHAKKYISKTGLLVQKNICLTLCPLSIFTVARPYCSRELLNCSISPVHYIRVIRYRAFTLPSTPLRLPSLFCPDQPEPPQSWFGLQFDGRDALIMASHKSGREGGWPVEGRERESLTKHMDTSSPGG